MTTIKPEYILVFACFMIPSMAFAYGEGNDVTYGARAMHLLINDARTNPADALKACPEERCIEGIDCYKNPSIPLYWRQDLRYVGELQAKLLMEANNDHFQENLDNNNNLLYKHCTPCKLKDSIGTDYPNHCNGKITECACVGGKNISSKDALDGTTCRADVSTSRADRAAYFVPKGEYVTENLACNQFFDEMFAPYHLYSQYMFEKGGEKDKCNEGSGNGHRMTICKENSTANLMGSGYATIKVSDGGFYAYTAQEYGKGAKPEDAGAIVSGSHYMDAPSKSNGRVWFKAVYSSSHKAETVRMNFDDQCISLRLTRGNDLYGTYSTSGIQSSQTCVPYFFEARDENGIVTRYPSRGSLLYNCDSSYTEEEKKSCLSDLKCQDDEHIHDNSCELDSLDNCGIHGGACEKNYTNWGSGACMNGQCVMDTCSVGSHKYEYIYAKTTVLSSSCVTDTTEDCGSSGYKCSEHIENWNKGICYKGQCIVTSCKTGFHPEGNDPDSRKCIANTSPDLKCNTKDNGYNHEYQGSCEENTSENCGSNGYNCLNYNAGWKEAACSNEKKATTWTCKLVSCSEGYKQDGDSDNCIPEHNCLSREHIYNNGCEADDLSNCGEHGNRCDKQTGWASGQCKDAQCVAESCKDGYSLKDGRCLPKENSDSCSSSNPSDCNYSDTNDSPNTSSGSDGCSARSLHSSGKSGFSWLLILTSLLLIFRRRYNCDNV